MLFGAKKCKTHCIYLGLPSKYKFALLRYFFDFFAVCYLDLVCLLLFQFKLMVSIDDLFLISFWPFGSMLCFGAHSNFSGFSLGRCFFGSYWSLISPVLLGIKSFFAVYADTAAISNVTNETWDPQWRFSLRRDTSSCHATPITRVSQRRSGSVPRPCPPSGMWCPFWCWCRVRSG